MQTQVVALKSICCGGQGGHCPEQKKFQKTKKSLLLSHLDVLYISLIINWSCEGSSSNREACRESAQCHIPTII
jgi:hypothetical protein